MTQTRRHSKGGVLLGYSKGGAILEYSKGGVLLRYDAVFRDHTPV